MNLHVFEAIYNRMKRALTRVLAFADVHFIHIKSRINQPGIFEYPSFFKPLLVIFYLTENYNCIMSNSNSKLTLVQLFAKKTNNTFQLISVFGYISIETVNTVCLGFSHEFTQFCQSWFYLKNGVKKVSRITYYWQRLHFFDCGAVFDLSAYFYPGHATLFGHLTRKQHVYQNQKEEAGNFQQGNPGLWSLQKYQVCGTIKYFPYTLKLGR